jgi:hypothetical protein
MGSWPKKYVVPKVRKNSAKYQGVLMHVVEQGSLSTQVEHVCDSPLGCQTQGTAGISANTVTTVTQECKAEIV